MLDYRLSGSMDRMDRRFGDIDEDLVTVKTEMNHMKSDLSEVKSDLTGLRFQLHKNHTTFITNQQEIEKRVQVLAAA